jgi:hypothetical protein
MAAFGSYELPNGNTLTLVEQAVLRSGERSATWEVLERDITGELVQRRIYDVADEGLAWIEGVL